MTRVFSWSEVDGVLVRHLLAAAYRSTQAWDAERNAVEALKRGTASDVEGVRRRFTADRWAEVAAPVLRERWVPKLPRQELELVTYRLIHSVSGPPSHQRPQTRAAMLDWIHARNNTVALSRALWTAFKAAHVADNGVARGLPGTVAEGRWRGEVVLRGAQSNDEPEARDYQTDAWKVLDSLAKASIYSSPLKANRTQGGLVEIPTGGGKTFTAIRWLVEQLEHGKDLRVLWIADKIGLVNQAAEEFVSCASLMASDSEIRMRVVHDGGSGVNMMVEPTVDVVCITRQSLHGRSFDAKAKARLRDFASRPVVVVVDEAHHAVSKSYEAVLNYIESHAPATLMIGLTATPWPAGPGMQNRLKERFPARIAKAETADLINRGILARPIIHARQSEQFIEIDSSDLKHLRGAGDLPEWMLDKLNFESRNRFIVETWKKHRKRWGKTLIFVGSIPHADDLGALFKSENITTNVVHSRSDEHYSTVLSRFKKADRNKPRVLISVAQLLEGVNVPDARTAVLARPTRSPILLRQMIGRVLRGPESGGDAEAHIIDVRDNWQDDLDLLSPQELVGLAARVAEPEDEDEVILPPLMDEASGEEIPADLGARVEKYFREMLADALFTDMLAPTSLIGFYQLDERSVPVFDHSADRWDELVADRLLKKPQIGSPISFFGDLPFPRPLKPDVDAVVEYVRSYEDEPPFTWVTLTLSPRAVAEELAGIGAMNESERRAWLRSRFRDSLARHAFADFRSFRQAVDAEVDRLQGDDPGLDAERPALNTRSRPRPLPRFPKRSIGERLSAVKARSAELLALESQDYRDHLLDGPDLSIDWTRRPVRSTLAYWVPRISGKAKGSSVIRVNVALRTSAGLVSDDALEYLIWHELVHYMRPGHGHDAEFRRLESLWPNSAALDYVLDSLCERYDLSQG